MFFLPFAKYCIREQPVTTLSYAQRLGYLALLAILICTLVASVYATSDTKSTAPEPVIYLNMNEGSGQNVVDLSGNGNSGTIHGASRTDNGACGGALQLNGINEYVTIPYSSKNHPEKEITVELWFAIYSYDRQVLISSYKDGGYRMAFDDGGDLWWTVNTIESGDISVSIQHENTPPNQWHHVAATYDGRTAKIYLDGILRNTVNASGTIHYAYNNYVMLGVDAGTGDQPDPQCNGYMKGGLDEVRIYNRALTYGEVMDDRFSCRQEPQALIYEKSVRILPLECTNLSSSFVLNGGDEMVRRVIVTDPHQQAIWNVHVPQGSTLSVNVRDSYSKVYPDFWYVELGDSGRRLTRSVAFPNTYYAPTESVIPSGNATVIIRYFDGVNRFPSSVFVDVRCIAPPPVIQEPLRPIFSNPIIVIYTASWATLIALILVLFWLKRRNKGKSA
jgi:hypothetical protein